MTLDETYRWLYDHLGKNWPKMFINKAQEQAAVASLAMTEPPAWPCDTAQIHQKLRNYATATTYNPLPETQETFNRIRQYCEEMTPPFAIEALMLFAEVLQVDEDSPVWAKLSQLAQPYYEPLLNADSSMREAAIGVRNAKRLKECLSIAQRLIRLQERLSIPTSEHPLAAATDFGWSWRSHTRHKTLSEDEGDLGDT